MDTATSVGIMSIVGVVIGALISLIGIFLQAYLMRKQAREHLLFDARKDVYSRLLFTAMSEENYPSDVIRTPLIDERRREEEITKYNEKVRIWRKERRILKAIASEALIFTTQAKLKSTLTDFIQNHDTNRLSGIEQLIREELKIQH